jgi:hypothetical protein
MARQHNIEEAKASKEEEELELTKYPPPPRPENSRATFSPGATPTAAAGRPDPAGDRAAWRDLERRLATFGLGDSRTPIVLARDHGLSAAEVTALIDFAAANAGRWENQAGALWKRISAGWPGQAAADGWPPPRKGAIARARAERQARAEAIRDRAAAAEAAALRDREAATRAAIEQRFGPQLDGLATAERDALAADLWPLGSIHWQRYRRLPAGPIADPLIRSALLRALRRRSDAESKTNSPARMHTC